MMEQISIRIKQLSFIAGMVFFLDTALCFHSFVSVHSPCSRHILKLAVEVVKNNEKRRLHFLFSFFVCFFKWITVLFKGHSSSWSKKAAFLLATCLYYVIVPRICAWNIVCVCVCVCACVCMCVCVCEGKKCMILFNWSVLSVFSFRCQWMSICIISMNLSLCMPVNI